MDNMPVGKTVMNSKLRTMNLVTHENLVKVATDCLSDIFQFLSRHYGYKSRYTLIIQNVASNGMSMNAMGSEADTKIFTKDGIESLSAVEYVSPVETFLKSLITYIGKRTEHSCCDGTTTAMMLASAILEKTFKEVKQFNSYPTKQIEYAYHDFIRDLLELYSEKYKYTVDKLYDSLKEQMEDYPLTKEEVVSAIAWAQAYTSSGGDRQIADCVSEAFKELPDCAWDSLKIRRSAIETDYKVSLMREESDFTFESYLVNQEIMKNHGSDIRLVLEDVNLMVYPFDIVDGSMDTIELMQFIDSYRTKYGNEETGKVPPLVIVSSQIHPKAIESVRALVTKHDIEVYLFAYAKKTSRVFNFDYQAWAVNAMAGIVAADAWDAKPLNERVISHARIEHQGKQLELHNLYEKKSDSILHPGVNDPENYPEFARFRTSMEMNINRLRKAHTVTVIELDELELVLSKAMCPKKPIIYIGGTSHDQLSLISVMNDVLGATLCTLKEGFYVNAITNLHQLFKYEDEYNKSYELFDQNRNDPLRKLLFIIFHEAINKLMEVERTQAISEHAFELIDAEKYVDYNTKLVPPFRILDFFELKIRNDENGMEVVGCPPMQVGKVFKEVFTRVGELVIRFAATSDLVVPGMAWDNTSEKE